MACPPICTCLLIISQIWHSSLSWEIAPVSVLIDHVLFWISEGSCYISAVFVQSYSFKSWRTVWVSLCWCPLAFLCLKHYSNTATLFVIVVLTWASPESIVQACWRDAIALTSMPSAETWVKQDQVAQTLFFPFTELKLSIRSFPFLLPGFLLPASLINFLSLLYRYSFSKALSQQTRYMAEILTQNLPCKGGEVSAQNHISSKVDLLSSSDLKWDISAFLNFTSYARSPKTSPLQTSVWIKFSPFSLPKQRQLLSSLLPGRASAICYQESETSASSYPAVCF